MFNHQVLVVATSRKTRGGITSVIKAHEGGEQWEKYHCHWVQTHRDGSSLRKICYLMMAWIDFLFRVPFVDLVHVHGTGGTSGRRKLAFITVAKFFRKKTIFHFHPSGEHVLSKDDSFDLLFKIFTSVDLVIVLSPYWEKAIRDAYQDRKIHIKVLWNPCPEVQRDGTRRKNQILYAGTLVKRKGYNVLLRAFARIASKHKDWDLVFAGNPYLLDGYNEMDDGKRIAHEMGISDQVKWLGWVAGDEKRKVFSESSIYCLASEGEGFPMGVLDAWAYGIPCVMTPVGGIPDIVENGKQGLMFSKGDVEGLARSLDIMIEDNLLREQIVNETDKMVTGVFSEKSVNSELENIYFSLLNDK